MSQKIVLNCPLFSLNLEATKDAVRKYVLLKHKSNRVFENFLNLALYHNRKYTQISTHQDNNLHKIETFSKLLFYEVAI